MQKARQETGVVVLASQVDPEQAPQMKLFCADPTCGAMMGFRKASLTHASSAVRTACFFSREAKQHIATCSAHQEIKIKARHAKSIHEALRTGKPIIFNLNMNLADEFNTVSAKNMIGVASTQQYRDYAAVPVKSIDEFMHYLNVIDDKAGADGMKKVFVNYQQSLTPVADFIMTEQQATRDLLNKMYKMLRYQMVMADEMTGPPRMMLFHPTRRTREGGDDIRGSSIVVEKEGGQKLVILQKLEADDKVKDALRQEAVFVIARPTLIYAEAARAHEALERGGKNTVYLDLHWQVTGAQQFTPVEQEKKPTAKVLPQP